MTELFIALSAGLISFLSPCVLPLIPGYIAYISGNKLEELIEKKSINLLPIFLFTIGFSIVFIIFFFLFFILKIKIFFFFISVKKIELSDFTHNVPSPNNAFVCQMHSGFEVLIFNLCYNFVVLFA